MTSSRRLHLPRPHRVVVATAAVATLACMLGLVMEVPSLGLVVGAVLPLAYGAALLHRRRIDVGLMMLAGGIAMAGVGLVSLQTVDARHSTTAADLPVPTVAVEASPGQVPRERAAGLTTTPGVVAPLAPIAPDGQQPVDANATVPSQPAAPSEVPSGPVPTSPAAGLPKGPVPPREVVTPVRPPAAGVPTAGQATAAQTTATAPPRVSVDPRRTQSSVEPTASPARRTPQRTAVSPRSAATCLVVNEKYPHGVGRPGAVDQPTAGRTPAAGFLESAQLYEAYRALDADGDGIACEG